MAGLSNPSMPQTCRPKVLVDLIDRDVLTTTVSQSSQIKVLLFGSPFWICIAFHIFGPLDIVLAGTSKKVDLLDLSTPSCCSASTATVSNTRL